MRPPAMTAQDRGAPLRHLRRRVLVLVILLLLMLGALVGRLTQVQVLNPTAATAQPQSAATQAKDDRASRYGTRQASTQDAREEHTHDPNLTTLVTPAIRGRILDRNGIPLVQNDSYPSLVMDRAVLASLDETSADNLFLSLGEKLGIDPDELRARTTSCGAPDAAHPPTCTPGSPAAPAILAPKLDAVQALAVAERPDLFPGVRIEPVATRAYPQPDGVLAAHVLGYLARATEEDVTASQGHVHGNELVGRAGLERQYDEILRGIPGHTLLRTDPRGVPLEVVEDVPPISGSDLRTTLDVRLQKVAEQSLEDQILERRRAGNVADSGAAVVLDLRDGGVLALASYPTYDPSVWVGGISEQDYAALTADDSHHPLINRVTEAGLAPASTFKAVTLPAAVAAGNPLTGTYSCPASYAIGGREFTNFGREDHGRITLHRAMEISCDTVFYDFAYQNWVSLGRTGAKDDSADPFIRTAREFGLGQPTGIDLPGEASGRVPGREWRRSYWEATKDTLCERAQTGYPEIADLERRDLLTAIARENCEHGYLYRGGDAANFSIGQGDVLTTPLQMAQVYAAVATGGPTMTPRLADALIDVRTGEVAELEPTPGVQVPLAADVSAYLRNSLAAVVETGTAAPGFAGFPLDEWPVAGKTGSAESGHGNDVSWFISYAPATSPRYVVAVAITQAGLGSEAAVPVARSIHETLRTIDAE